MLPTQDFVRTGIRGLDGILSGGGVPRGNVILVEGAIGTGKTTLGIEFIYNGASQFNEPGIIVLFETSPDKLVRDAATLGWDLQALEHEKRLRIVFTTRQVFRQEMQQADSLLLEEATGMGARRIFVDGVSRLTAGGNDVAAPREAFQILVEGLQRENLTAMLAVEAMALGEDEASSSLPEESIADTVIRLRMEPSNRATVRSIEIVKSRGHHYQMGRHSFKIVDGSGIHVYRRVQAPRRDRRDRAAAFDPTTRVTTGTPGLDAIVNGGYFLGSTTVVAGISGVGKSVLGLQYLAEGVKRGERGLMFTLDEQVPQMLRNAMSIGIDFGPAVADGTLQLFYDPPQEIEIDEHFHRIEELVERFKPTRVVIDSLSTYGSSLGTGGRVFRDFFHALVALMKECQVAAVYNIENPDLLGMSSMMGSFAMSSLVDNIILMNWIETGDRFRLGLTVGKMRANPTDRVTYECEIVDRQGLRVLPRALPVKLAAPFSSYQSLVSRAPARQPQGRSPDDDEERGAG